MITRKQIVEEIVPQIEQDNFREAITNMMQKDELTKEKLTRNSNVYMDKMLELSCVIDMMYEIIYSDILRDKTKLWVLKQMLDPCNRGHYGIRIDRINGMKYFEREELKRIMGNYCEIEE